MALRPESGHDRTMGERTQRWLRVLAVIIGIFLFFAANGPDSVAANVRRIAAIVGGFPSGALGWLNVDQLTPWIRLALAALGALLVTWAALPDLRGVYRVAQRWKLETATLALGMLLLLIGAYFTYRAGADILAPNIISPSSQAALVPSPKPVVIPANASGPTIPADFRFRQRSSWSGRGGFSKDPNDDSYVFSYGPVVVTNLSARNKLSLEVSLRIRGPDGLDLTLPNADHDGAGRVFAPGAAAAMQRANRRMVPNLPEIIALGPQESTTGKLMFVAPSSRAVTEALLTGDVHGDLKKVLVVRDNVSGQTVEFPADQDYRGQLIQVDAPLHPEAESVATAESATHLRPQETPQANDPKLASKMQVSNFDIALDGAGVPQLKVAIKNIGSVPGDAPNYTVSAKAWPDYFTESEAEAFMRQVAALALTKPLPKRGLVEIDPGESVGTASNMPLDKADWEKVKAGQAKLHIGVVLKYADATTPPGSYWITEVCGGFGQALGAMRACANRTYLHAEK